VQTFDYRGSLERSLPGQVTVLHPDERHDGRAGTDSGFGYRIVYVAPAQIGAALCDIIDHPTPLPFVREPVTLSPRLASAVTDAFASGLQPLARDGLVLRPRCMGLRPVLRVRRRSLDPGSSLGRRSRRP
jgi:hypothetical protein